MKKLILLLTLFSLPAAWAMDLDERKDEGLEFPASHTVLEHDGQYAAQAYEPDYSREQDVEEEYVSVEGAMAIFKEKDFYDRPNTKLKNILRDPHLLPAPIILPEPIAHLIAQYIEGKEIDSCDVFIEETPLYVTHLFPLSIKMRQQIKTSFYQRLENALIQEQQRLGLKDASASGIRLTDALMIGDMVWKELLETTPYPNKTHGWAILPDKKIIAFFRASDSDDYDIERYWHALVYDLENNCIINLTKFPRHNLQPETLERSHDGTATIIDANKLKEMGSLSESEYPVITYNPYSNKFSSEAVFCEGGRRVKTVYSEYNVQDKDFVETLVVETPILSEF